MPLYILTILFRFTYVRQDLEEAERKLNEVDAQIAEVDDSIQHAIRSMVK